jgi:hypothetical protein
MKQYYRVEERIAHPLAKNTVNERVTPIMSWVDDYVEAEELICEAAQEECLWSLIPMDRVSQSYIMEHDSSVVFRYDNEGYILMLRVGDRRWVITSQKMMEQPELIEWMNSELTWGNSIATVMMRGEWYHDFRLINERNVITYANPESGTKYLYPQLSEVDQLRPITFSEMNYLLIDEYTKAIENDKEPQVYEFFGNYIDNVRLQVLTY